MSLTKKEYSTEQYLNFINIATSEMKFSKSILATYTYYQTKNIILKDHVGNSRTIGLIVYKCPAVKNKEEFQYYSRNTQDEYDDWKEYKIIDFVKMQRKDKINKIKDCIFLSL